MLQPIPADQVRKAWTQTLVALGAAAVSGVGAWFADRNLHDQPLAAVYWTALVIHAVAALWYAARLSVPRAQPPRERA